MAPLALVVNLTTRWPHYYWLQIWPPDGATCIACKFDHQMAPLALAANLATRYKYWSSSAAISMVLPFSHYQFVSTLARVTSVKSTKHLGVKKYCPFLTYRSHKFCSFFLRYFLQYFLRSAKCIANICGIFSANCCATEK